ncbi:protein kinase domain-containing protein [Streptomyces sp. 1331.2]|uniref:protein kinase domain-containing protein n=1 Tax=Streptomyces sp. 1331.2 TaxID=1938835 RepID=UPI000BD9A3B8|nr:protein kinase [Streptomyces sp. 1331.2]SOB83662.1 Protein kinase domain-containing protein [Streptomyces sp. 1331.2]
MRGGPGQLAAGRYRLTDRPEPLCAHAVDERTGESVLLRGLELPGLLTTGLDPEDAAAAQADRLVRRVAAVGSTAPTGHPRLLRGLGAFVEDELLWTVEERPAGGTAAELLVGGPLSPYRAAELAADLAGALRALHGAGLTHGNLTAESVLVCEDGAAMLGGLLAGVAQEALAEELGGPGGRRRYEVRATLVGAVAERWPLDGGPAGDCWALGVLLHRLVTGRSPYPEGGVPELVTAVRDGRREHSAVCGPLGPLVERLLQPDPARRPTAEDVRRELAELLAGAPEPVDEERVARAVMLKPEAPLVPRRRESVGGGSKPPRIPPSLLGPLLVGAVFVLLALGMAAVVLFAG